jgi:hypothetical protein
MSWSFNAALLTNKDKVRFHIGDTNTNRQLVQDETIEAILGTEANVYMAAATILEGIARGLTAGGVLEDRKVGETRIRYRRAADLRADANALRMRGAAHMKPSAGGIYTSDTTASDNDTSLEKSEISRRMFSNPRTYSSVTNATT